MHRCNPIVISHYNLINHDEMIVKQLYYASCDHGIHGAGTWYYRVLYFVLSCRLSAHTWTLVGTRYQYLLLPLVENNCVESPAPLVSLMFAFEGLCS